jgi:hypothetical protein
MDVCDREWIGSPRLFQKSSHADTDNEIKKKAKVPLSKEEELKLLREEVSFLEKKVEENKLKILGNVYCNLLKLFCEFLW